MHQYFYAPHQNLANHFYASYINTFLNFGPNYSTGMKLLGTSMVFTSYSGPYPAARDFRSLVAGNGI